MSENIDIKDIELNYNTESNTIGELSIYNEL